MKTIWDIAKLITGKKKNYNDIQQINTDGTLTSNSQIVSNSFNNYFLSIIENAISIAKNNNPIDYLYQAKNCFQRLSIKIHPLLKLKKLLHH